WRARWHESVIRVAEPRLHRFPVVPAFKGGTTAGPHRRRLRGGEHQGLEGFLESLPISVWDDESASDLLDDVRRERALRDKDGLREHDRFAQLVGRREPVV